MDAIIRLGGPDRRISVMTDSEEPIGESVERATIYKLSDLVGDVTLIVKGLYTYKGSKATYSELPSTGNEVGDVWNVDAAYNDNPSNTNYAWDGSAWCALSGSSTLSGLSDVSISVPTQGQALVYNGSVWENSDTSGGGGSSTGDWGTEVVTVSNKKSLQAVTNLSPSFPGTTRGNGSVDLQQYRFSDTAIASGTYSVVMGNSNTAIGESSIAMGEGNTAVGTYSVAMGRISIASGTSSVAMGYYNIASGNYSVAMGESNEAGGEDSVAMGYGNTASGNYSVAMGETNTASGDYSVAMGDTNTASGNSSVAMGYNNTTSGNSSVAIGGYNTTSGYYSVATGYMNNCAISGAVTNNNASSNNVLQYNRFGHAGFKGFNDNNDITDLFNLSNTDVLIARIDVISPIKIASFFVVVSGSTIQSCTITADVYHNANPGDIFMSNGVLRLYTSWYPTQVGMFYTLYSNVAGGSSSSSSSSN